MGDIKMKSKILAALPIIGALGCAGHAQAGTFYFSLGGDGNVSISGYLTSTSDSYADTGNVFGTPSNLVQVGPTVPGPGWQSKVDPSNALAITGITGTFSDVALNIVDEPIESLVMTVPQAHYDEDYTIPYSFGWYPGIPATAVSYDNLFYAGAEAPVTCLTVPAGGYLDGYGVLFTLQDGTVVDMYGFGGSGNSIYGAVVWAAGADSPDYTSAYVFGTGLTLTVPEPSTWAMMLFGFAGLGFAGYRKSHKSAAIAA